MQKQTSVIYRIGVIHNPKTGRIESWCTETFDEDEKEKAVAFCKNRTEHEAGKNYGNGAMSQENADYWNKKTYVLEKVTTTIERVMEHKKPA